MSITSDVRNYADQAVLQGKGAVTAGKNALDSASTVVTDALTEALSDAPKPAFVALGVADLLAETLTRRAEALPADALANLLKAQETGKAQFEKLSETGKARVTKAQTDAVARVSELRGKLDAGLAQAQQLRSVDVPNKAKETADGYVALAKNLFASLSARGETTFTELKNDPRYTKLVGEVTDVAETVESTVRPVVGQVVGTLETTVAPLVQQVRDSYESTVAPVVEQAVEQAVNVLKSASPIRRGASVAPTATVITTPANTTAAKAPAKKAAAKAPAKKAPAAKAPAKKAAAKAPAKKAPAKKAPATKAPATTVPATKAAATKASGSTPSA